MKIGGDFIKYTMSQGWCNVCDGQFTSTQRPPANLEQLLPSWNDASTWNWTALSPFMRDYNVTVGNMSYQVHRQIYAAWYQDDWKASSKLTVNLGLRFDLDHGAQGEWVQFLPWLSGKRPTDKNNFGPRTGFAYQVNDKTVIRGGWGVFFTQLEDDALHQSTVLNLTTNVLVPNNGRPDFALNPFGGPKPTYAQANAQACDVLGGMQNLFLQPVLTQQLHHDAPYSEEACDASACRGVKGMGKLTSSACRHRRRQLNGPVGSRHPDEPNVPWLSLRR